MVKPLSASFVRRQPLELAVATGDVDNPGSGGVPQSGLAEDERAIEQRLPGSSGSRLRAPKQCGGRWGKRGGEFE
jgi:hypothetical protein